MPKLNPNEAPEGYVAVYYGKAIGCGKCCFREAPDCLQPCVANERADGCYVIFKRKPTKPTKPTRKPREWMAWAFQTKAPLDVVDLSYICEKRKFARKYNAELGGTGVIRVKITEVL